MLLCRGTLWSLGRLPRATTTIATAYDTGGLQLQPFPVGIQHLFHQDLLPLLPARLKCVKSSGPSAEHSRVDLYKKQLIHTLRRQSIACDGVCGLIVDKDRSQGTEFAIVRRIRSASNASALESHHLEVLQSKPFNAEPNRGTPHIVIHNDRAKPLCSEPRPDPRLERVEIR